MSWAYRLSGSCFSYANVPALRSVTFDIRQGERIALLGANGSGKSTLLRLLAGLSFADQGTVSFNGQLLTERLLRDKGFFLQFRRSVGVVFQNPDVQLFNASVFDEVAFGPLQMRWGRDEIVCKVEQQLKAMGISALRDRPPHRLSGGEKKRVALASVLVLEPEILLLDEPAAGLDPASEKQILDLIGSWRGGARTVITATHDLATLEKIADRCCVLKNGELIAEGDPLPLMHDTDLLMRAGLLRPFTHVHHRNAVSPHPHVHVADATRD